MNKRAPIPFRLIFSLLIFFVSCSALPTNNTETDNAVSDHLGSSTTGEVTTSGTIENDGEDTQTMSSSEIPDDFPSFIPFPERSEITQVTSDILESVKTDRIYLTGNGNMNDILALYTKVFKENGYVKSYTESLDEDNFSISATNVDVSKGIMVSFVKTEKNGYTLTITFMYEIEDEIKG